MSLLSQLVPRQPDAWTRIGLAGSTTVQLPMSKPSEPGRRRSGDSPTLNAAEDLARILLCDDTVDEEALARLEAGVDEHVDVWTPAIHTTSRFELVSTLAALDDAIADVKVRFTASAPGSSIVFLEWQATGRFARPAFLDDDNLIEPTGAVIRLPGATSVSFERDGRADHIRCYYDRLALIEQLLTPRQVVGGC